MGSRNGTEITNDQETERNNTKDQVETKWDQETERNVAPKDQEIKMLPETIFRFPKPKLLSRNW